jgi:hydroxymethylglutaryl-CoA synthase
VIKAGIDAIAFATAPFALHLKELAAVRGFPLNKFYETLGQITMGVPSPDEDIVTLAANAGLQVLKDVDPSSIELLLFATESGVDQSKAAGIFVHDLLNLNERCRIIELKQACYSATVALQLALPFLRENPTKKVLLIAADIARYGLNTTGESSQGCGACAMLLSVNPRVIAFEAEYGVVTDNVMDFWRPNYSDAAFVEGKYSSKLYLQMLEKSWLQYQERSKRSFEEHAYHCYHMPVPRLVEKAHQHLAKVCGLERVTPEHLQSFLTPSLEYGRQIGNSYSASLYVGLTSLLDHVLEDLSQQRIGFYSYGSGCVAEYFSGIIQPDYKKTLHTEFHQSMLKARRILSYTEYADFYDYPYPRDGSTCDIPVYTKGPFRLAALREHKRIYEKNV